MQNHRIFKPRKCDFQKNKKPGQPLSKDGSRLSKTNAPKYGGAENGGPVAIASSKGKDSSLYYVNIHGIQSYFAIEIVQFLGLNTPKTRLIEGKIKDHLHHENNNRSAYFAAKGIPNLIPVGFMNRTGDPYPYQPGSNDIRRRYQLNTAEQTVCDKETHTPLRIAGHTYASFIIAKLIGDADFQEQDYNFNLARIGNRFYPVAIDKEGANFSGRIVEHLRWIDSDFKTYCQLDQQLAVALAIKNGLQPSADGVCDFDRIFLNPRVKATPFICERAETYLARFKVTAQSIIDIFLRRDAGIFAKFQQRENYRQAIANSVLEQLNLPRDLKNNELAKLIIEDLRGPYYQAYFFSDNQISAADCDNEDLIVRIMNDVAHEFGLSVKQKAGCCLQ